MNDDAVYYCQHKGCGESFANVRGLVAHAVKHAQAAEDQKTLSLKAPKPESKTMMSKLFGRKSK